MFDIPFLDIPPLVGAAGDVALPGSKSISNRVLLLAALSEGCTTVHDLLDSDDTRVMLQALQALGCDIRHQPDGSVRITGLAGQLPITNAELFLGNAGTAMRPLAAALALLAAVNGGQFLLTGVARMHERPIGDLVDALAQLGCPIAYTGQTGYPPLRVGSGEPVALDLSQPIRVRGDVSSQFLTALLLALPLVTQGRPGTAQCGQSITIEVQGELISKPYIDITLNLLARFGVQIERQGWQTFTLPANAHYVSPGDIHVEGDASSASYFIALGALAAPVASGDGIRISGVGTESIQGDIRFIEAAESMGAITESGPNWLHVRRGCWPLRPITLDCNHIPDAAMTLGVMALYASGTTRLTNIASWRVKETDRIAAMASELRKLGATVDEGPDWIAITPPATPQNWRAASIHTYDDHRMAMCLSLAAFNPGQVPVRIQDPKCVAKTFPDYFEALMGVASAAHAHIPVVCIDGPTASGKGTLAAAVAQRLGYHVLDSGALYRLVGVAAERAGLSTSTAALSDPAQAERIAQLARHMRVRFQAGAVLLDDHDVSQALRTESAGMAASRVSALPGVREALLQLQRDFRQLPGLVADGRDMGTVVFPDAALKVYLTASAACRAERRHAQLVQRGEKAIIQDLLQALEQRDEQDKTRTHAPLKPAEDAVLLDNSEDTIEQSVSKVMGWWSRKQPF